MQKKQNYRILVQEWKDQVLKQTRNPDEKTGLGTQGNKNDIKNQHYRQMGRVKCQKKLKEIAVSIFSDLEAEIG